MGRGASSAAGVGVMPELSPGGRGGVKLRVRRAGTRRGARGSTGTVVPSPEVRLRWLRTSLRLAVAVGLLGSSHAAHAGDGLPVGECTAAAPDTSIVLMTAYIWDHHF